MLHHQIDEIFHHFDLEVTSDETKDFIGPAYIVVHPSVLQQCTYSNKYPLNQFTNVQVFEMRVCVCVREFLNRTLHWGTRL